MKFRAKVNCQFNSRIYKSGTIIDVDKIGKCPDCNGEKKKDGKPCFRCQGTGRISPPHFFEPFHPEVEAKAEVEKAKSETDELDGIRAEMDAIGAAYDRRWKLPKMRDALIAAKKEGKKEE
jgi:hypothetical protein